MGAQTTIKHVSGDKVTAVKVITESYITGTYNIWYNVSPDTGESIGSHVHQSACRTREDKFHENIRKKVAKDYSILEEYSTPMTMIKESVKQFWEKNKQYYH